MGTCMSNTASVRRSKDFSNYPNDIDTYTQARRASLQKLKFESILYNVTVTNLQKNSVSFKFEVDGLFDLLLPRISKPIDSDDVKWPEKHKICFSADQYELRVKFLVISFVEDQSKKKEVLRINLFKIATGPYHNDFLIKEHTRIKFDFKVSQYVSLNIKCNQTKAELSRKQYPGESFYFSIRVLKQQNDQPFESSPSYTITSPLQTPLLLEGPSTSPILHDECPSPIKIIRNKSSQKNNQPRTSLSWNQFKGQLPNFSIGVKANTIQSTILHFVVWREQNGGGSQEDGGETSDTEEGSGQMLCEAFTHFSRILQKDPVMKRDKSGNHVEERILYLEKEGLWSDGEKIGDFSIEMAVENNIFIKQMKACTQTEEGIIESTPLFSVGIGYKKQKKLQKFVQIENQLHKIQQINKQLNQNSKLSYLNVKKLKLQMISDFQKIKIFLQSDLENSFYVPTTQAHSLNLMDEQTLLMSIMSRVIAYSEDDDTLTEVCWAIANLIARRGEFQLPNIGFTKNDQLEIKKAITPYYKKKIQVALEFQELEYKLLLQSLRIGYIQGREDPRKAVEMFRAYAYFRVPCYREAILRQVVRKSDSSIQWNTSTPDQSHAIPEDQNILYCQLDWQNNFYKPLEIDSKSQALTREMIENLQGSLWLEQISKRGPTFFYFLYFLISKLSELGKRIKFMKWSYFPGYTKLVRAFLFQMRNIKVEKYPQSMIQTSIYLLANDQLLNVLINIIFENCNVNDNNGLMKGLDLISRYLNHFKKNKKILPPSFNYVYFFKGLKIVIENEFTYATVKVLSIIFMNFDNFNVEFKKNLSLYLLSKVFFRLFLNWSFTTRKAFYHVLLLKIQKASTLDGKNQISQISQKYDQSIAIIRNACKTTKKEDKTQIQRNQNHDLYKHLKKKLVFIKKKAQQIQSAEEINSTTSPISGSKSVVPLGSPFHNNNNFSMLDELAKLSSKEKTMNTPKLMKFSSLTYKNQIQNVVQERAHSGVIVLDQLDSMNFKTPKKGRERRRSIYGVDEFEMKQMQKKESKYLQIALLEFDTLNQAIQSYYSTYKKFPDCELDVEVPIDQKQIKPSMADFEDWQTSDDDPADIDVI